MKLKWISITICLAATAGPALASDYNGPDIIADQVMDGGGKGKVYRSQRGMRVESSTPSGKMTMAMDNKTGQCWSAYDSKKIYMAGKLTKGGDCTANMSMGSPMGGEVHETSGLLSNQPCAGADLKKQLGEETHQGRSVEKWACGYSATRTEGLQWYDARLKLVVRDQLDGRNDSLVNIKKQSVPATAFSLPRGYRKVSKSQFMQIVMSDVMSKMMNSPGR